MPTHLILSPPSTALMILYEKTVEKLLHMERPFNRFLLCKTSPNFALLYFSPCGRSPVGGQASYFLILAL